MYFEFELKRLCDCWKVTFAKHCREDLMSPFFPLKKSNECYVCFEAGAYISGWPSGAVILLVLSESLA